MIKHQIFVNKHLTVQTQRNKCQEKIFNLFKLVNKDTTAMTLTYFDMILLCI